MSLSLRAANENDAHLLWTWANDPLCRENAFDSSPIDWDAHTRWLRQKLTAPDCRIWILEHDGQPVGQIRYDRRETDAEIDFAVAPQARGLGLGTQLLTLSVIQAHQDLGVRKVFGLIKTNNRASVRAFNRAGFEEVGQFARGSEICVRFEHENP
jgi:RimJ/RimL family protein N-acetyltransferase